MSILIATLNHNLPELTDNIVEQVKQSKYIDYELMVVENGSQEPRAKSATHVLDHNVFYGGGINVILDYFLKTNHDYLMVLNNDLIFHGYNFIQEMISTAELFNLSVLSPSIINAETTQCHWKQMHCWCTNDVREVKWIDFQAPMLRRDICEKIIQFPTELYLGWGVDFYTGLVAAKHGLKIGVHDGVTITHLNSQTFRQNKLNIDTKIFCFNAEKNMNDYFKNHEYQAYLLLRNYGEAYTY